MTNTSLQLIHSNDSPTTVAVDTGATIDREYIEFIYQKYRKPLLRFLSEMLPRQEDAEEILQETYLRLFNRHSRDIVEANIRAYLFKIATNLVRDHFRSNTVRRFGDHVSLEEEILISEFPSPEKQLEWDQAVRIIRKCLLDLDERCRNIFVMHKFRHMSYEEIADVLKISVRTVERNMSISVNYCKCQLEKFL